MFGRSHNLKRMVASGAILLSLSTLAQACGFYCYLGACGASIETTLSECTCCHQGGSFAEEPCAPEQSSEEHDACPCSEECWCHEAPQPYDQAKSNGEPLKLAYFTLIAIVDPYFSDVVACRADQLNLRVPPDAGDHSAVERCSKLCRFLI
ncbi:hypothetical protein [Aeoliella sp. SH292]|uniref:hypothetical protein n=1 Tax=Aeoliella sp. SH292 TaxID=3454464 RepID=UPI003F948397